MSPKSSLGTTSSIGARTSASTSGAVSRKARCPSQPAQVLLPCWASSSIFCLRSSGAVERTTLTSLFSWLYRSVSLLTIGFWSRIQPANTIGSSRGPAPVAGLAAAGAPASAAFAAVGAPAGAWAAGAWVPAGGDEPGVAPQAASSGAAASAAARKRRRLGRDRNADILLLLLVVGDLVSRRPSPRGAAALPCPARSGRPASGRAGSPARRCSGGRPSRTGVRSPRSARGGALAVGEEVLVALDDLVDVAVDDHGDLPCARLSGYHRLSAGTARPRRPRPRPGRS